MERLIAGYTAFVNCRTGSLEKYVARIKTDDYVNCRTGSLEIYVFIGRVSPWVNCRTGSLEKLPKGF